MSQYQGYNDNASSQEPAHRRAGETGAAPRGRQNAMSAWEDFLRNSGAPASPAVPSDGAAFDRQAGRQRTPRRGYQASERGGRMERDRRAGREQGDQREQRERRPRTSEARTSNDARRQSGTAETTGARTQAGRRPSARDARGAQGAGTRRGAQGANAKRDTARKNSTSSQARPSSRRESSSSRESASPVAAADVLARAGALAKQFAGNKRLVIAAVVAVLLIIVIAWYAGGAGRYHENYYPNTEAFGVPIGELSPAEVQALANEQLAGYTLHITGSTIDVQIPGNEIGLAIASSQSAQDILDNQNTLFWPIMQLLPHDVSNAFDIVYNTNSLLGAIQLAASETNGAALNAANNEVHFDKQSNQWVYQAAEAGTTIDVDKLVSALDQPIRELQTEFTVPASCVSQVQLTGTAAQKQAAAQKANELCSQYNLVFMLGESTPLTIDAAVASDWITINSDYEVSIDQSKVDAWLASLRNLLSGTDERTYVRPDGKMCTVTGGDYGWLAQDVDEAIATIRAGLDSGISGQSIPCTWEGNGFLGVPGADWGKRYIDVDMIEQHARFYDENGNVMWESDVITGVWGTEFETPTGVYTITEKRSPAQLRSVGEYVYVDENGETQVEEDHVFGRDVEYWMPFIGTFIGFHDAWWQTDFGGQLYRDGALGSGGCVNLPSDKAEELYQIILPGDVVVAHN